MRRYVQDGVKREAEAYAEVASQLEAAADVLSRSILL
jgi:hypothetical protein